MPFSVQDDTRLRASPLVVSVRQGATIALLDARTGQYFSLNDVGSLAWEALCDGACPTDIAGVIAAEYAVDPTQALPDVRKLVSGLSDAGLVVAA